MDNENFFVYGDPDFVDDWMFYAASGEQISNAILRGFLLNRGHLEYTHRDGVVYDVDRSSDQKGSELRRKYYSLMDEDVQLNRFGMLIVSPFAQPGNDIVPMRVSCHCLTICSGSPKLSAKQLLKAIHRFRFSPDWSFLRRRGNPVSFSVPVRLFVFEIDDYWKGTYQRLDLRLLKKVWLRDVARHLESNYLQDATFSVRLYLLSNFNMQFISAELIASCRPIIRALAFPGEDSDEEFSCSDSSEYD